MEEQNKFGELLEERRNPHKEFLSTLRFFVVLLAIFLCFTILFTKIFIGVQVVGSSMVPTLYTGDYLFINATVSPEHGDIVVIEANERDSVHDKTEHKWIIKRVIGLPETQSMPKTASCTAKMRARIRSKGRRAVFGGRLERK